MSRVVRQNIKGEPKVTGVKGRKGNYATYTKSGASGGESKGQVQGVKGDKQKFGNQVSSDGQGGKI